MLGAEQSGHIIAVGYDMYCRLLKAAVARARGQVYEDEPGEIEVELGVTAFLPAEYVTDEAVRMSLLRRLAQAGKKRLDGLEREMVDRFGRLPGPAQQLLALFRLRRLVRLAGVTSALTDGLGGLVFTVGDVAAFEKRSPFRSSELSVVSPGRFRIIWPDGCETPADRLRYLLERFAGRTTPLKEARTPS